MLYFLLHYTYLTNKLIQRVIFTRNLKKCDYFSAHNICSMYKKMFVYFYFWFLTFIAKKWLLDAAARLITFSLKYYSYGILSLLQK